MRNASWRKSESFETITKPCSSAQAQISLSVEASRPTSVTWRLSGNSSASWRTRWRGLCGQPLLSHHDETDRGTHGGSVNTRLPARSAIEVSAGACSVRSRAKSESDAAPRSTADRWVEPFSAVGGVQHPAASAAAHCLASRRAGLLHHGGDPASTSPRASPGPADTCRRPWIGGSPAPR